MTCRNRRWLQQQRCHIEPRPLRCLGIPLQALLKLRLQLRCIIDPLPDNSEAAASKLSLSPLTLCCSQLQNTHKCAARSFLKIPFALFWDKLNGKVINLNKATAIIRGKLAKLSFEENLQHFLFLDTQPPTTMKAHLQN